MFPPVFRGIWTALLILFPRFLLAADFEKASVLITSYLFLPFMFEAGLLLKKAVKHSLYWPTAACPVI